MKQTWVDANVVVRFITGDPPDFAERAHALVARASEGDLEIRIAVLIVGEIVWVLDSFDGHSRRDIAEKVGGFLSLPGVSADDGPDVTRALLTMADKNVSFVDAYLAQLSERTSIPVASFDRDMRRLNTRLLEEL